MKKLGEGWQYSVYDLGNGRVLKKFHSWPRSFWIILKTIFPFRDDPFWVIPDFIRGTKQTALKSIEILKNRKIPPEWIGNPKFLNTLDFEQDKSIPLHEVLKSNTDENRKIVDQFIEFNKRLLDFGIIDKSFNITKNYGLSSGKIVLIDIGELFDDPAKIEKQRGNRAWSKSYVADHIPNTELRNYFLDQMDKHFGLP